MAPKEQGCDSGGVVIRRNLQVMSPSSVPVDATTTPSASVMRKSSRSRSASRPCGAGAARTVPGALAGSNPSQMSGRNPSPVLTSSSAQGSHDVARRSSVSATPGDKAVSRVKSEGPSQGRDAFESPTKAILRSEVEAEKTKQIHIEMYADSVMQNAKGAFMRTAQQYEQSNLHHWDQL